jgi:hypothetical protein
VVVSLGIAVVLVLLLAGRRHEFEAALSALVGRPQGDVEA